MVVDELYKDAADNEVSTGFSFNADVLQRAIKNIYERKYNPNKEIDGHLLEEVHRIINAATDIGFSGREADGEFMRQLKSNNGVFAAFKTHRMGRDIASRLIDDNGEVKSFQQFQQDVEPITSHHIDRWLRTEYDTAIKRAQQAADMMQYREEADVLPNLEWLPSTAMKPREDHMVFYHHIWAIDDPFWQKHKPGDQWGCQCDLAPTDAPITDNEGLGGEPNAKPSKGLSGDPSRTGIIFSDDHPYFPSDCNHCVFNSNQFNIFRNKKKDCHQCASIRSVVAFKATPQQIEASKKQVNEFKQSIPKGQMKIVKIDDPIIGELTISRQSVKGWCSHPFKYILERNNAITNLKKLFNKAKYFGWAEDDIVNISGVMRQKHQDTKYWLYYRVVINDEESYICVKHLHDGRYVPYCLNDQRSWHDTAPKVQQELPPNIKK